MLEDRIGRLEKVINADAATRQKRIEEEQKETSKFLTSIMQTAKMETVALKKKVGLHIHAHFKNDPKLTTQT
tara:strand:+ start:116 stop:331 length:216 start_codon:yes stop_codon:yes gene_type:complete